MEWVTVVMVALAGFVGAGSVSMWRTEHRATSVVLAVLALVFLAIGVIALLPGPEADA